MTMIFPVCLSLEQSTGTTARCRVRSGGGWQNLLKNAGFGRMGERCGTISELPVPQRENADLCSSV